MPVNLREWHLLGQKFYHVVSSVTSKPQKRDIGNKDITAQFEIGNAISILISSEFLKMEGLVEECLDFVAKRINDIVRLPIDMSCISGILLKKLASRI